MATPSRIGRHLLLLVLPAQLAVASAVAQPMALPRLNGSVVLDGMPDEAAWEAIEPLPVVTYEPTFGQTPSEPTEIRIAYDDAYLYGALRAYDSAAGEGGIRANSLYRDRLSGDDIFVILLDTFDDNESAITFTMTPAGVRRDAAVSNDASGPGTLNTDFNTFWDLETRITEEGWFAEVRIPFSSLRFEDDDGRVVMGLITQRLISRRNERITFPALSASVSRAFIKPSLARTVMMEGVYSRRPFYVTPYGLSGATRDEVSGEAGVDLKAGLASDLTLDLTVNTDFAQVEADDQQVNLTRFSLFFPEKRQFFQERSGLFEFRLGGESRLFHSRRIGLTEEGQPVRILGGARLTGRVGRWDVGLLDMQTAEYGGLPSENFGVLRLRRPVLNAFSFAGAMLTSRVSVDGGYNVAYGIDGVFRLFADDYFSLKWAHTFDDADRAYFWDEGPGTGRLLANMERRRDDGFGYDATVLWSGPDYAPGVGFTRRNDFTMVGGDVSYTWVPGIGAAFIRHTLTAEATVYHRNFDGVVESVEVGPAWEAAFKSGDDLSLAALTYYEDLALPFVLSEEAFVPAGRYTFAGVVAEYDMPSSRYVRSGATLEAGSFFDGWRMTMGLLPEWVVSRHLDFSLEYLFNRVRFPDRDQRYDAHVARLRIGTALNIHLSTNAFLQYNSDADAVSANVRFRYNFGEGNDLWVVYNELQRGAASALFQDTRALMVKYTYTFGS